MSGLEVAFFGVLGRDAESKISGSGRNYLRLNVRVGDGDAVQWVGVTCFDSKAIDVVDKLTKGARVYVEGRLTLDEWTGQDGAKRHGLSTVAWHCRLSAIGCNRPKREQNEKAPASGRERANRSDFAPAGVKPTFNDDDITFGPEVR